MLSAFGRVDDAACAVLAEMEMAFSEVSFGRCIQGYSRELLCSSMR